MKIAKGIAASPGVAIGRAVIWKKQRPTVYARALAGADVEAELVRLRSARSKALVQLGVLGERTKREVGAKEAEIFEAHANIVEDPSFLSEVENAILSEKINAELAVHKIVEKLISSFGEQRFTARLVADLLDVRDRLIAILSGQDYHALQELKEDAVLVSFDLGPFDVASLDKKRVLALVTERGGATSHMAILARALGIPASVGVGGVTSYVNPDDLLIVDGTEGTVILNPDPATIERFEYVRKKSFIAPQELSELKDLSAETVDRRRVQLLANIGVPEEAPLALQFGADGIGLFRTEFSYIGKTGAPSVEELSKAYRTVASQMAGRRVNVRTLDVGGDKPLPYIPTPKEENPFLGWRGLRVSLERPELFKMQLEAVLRGSAFGNLGIMFPMISTLDELRQAKSTVGEVKRELRESGVPFKEDIEIGMMVETPAAAILADLLAKETDFFSIGTNDLTQYVPAADRTNEKVSYLFDGLDPTVLRLIKNVIESGHREGRSVAMCGELAGDPVATPILLGLGLDEFSISPSGIPLVKKIVRSLSYSEARKTATEALTKSTAKEVREVGKGVLKLL